MKYHIVTYGCQMNVHESEKMAGMLSEKGYTDTCSPESADLIIFNTCSIREHAVKRLMSNIGALKSIKHKNTNLTVAICGCATQNKKDAEIIREKFPFVDIIFGTHNIHLLTDYLDSKQNDGKKIFEIWEKESGEFYNLPVTRSNSISANVNIMYGCNNFCSYCIVPYVRGRERSRPINDIINEIEGHIASGAKEIMLLGQNVNSYGNDIGNSEINFSALLNKAAALPGKFRIKFMTSHPKDLSAEVVRAIRNNAKINKHIHLPVQSGSNSVLTAMNRKYTREHYLELIQMIRNEIPEASITSDIIVGFPGETENDFEDTLELIEKVGFSGIYAFIFSPRNGTKAYDMPDNMSEKEKKQRLTRLLSAQKKISQSLAVKKLHKTYEVLCIKDDGENLVALTDADEVINISKIRQDSEKEIFPQSLEGEFLNVKVVSVKNSRLFGEVI